MKKQISISETPYAKDAEDAVLGAIMTYEDTFTTVSAILTPRMFYDARNQNVYEAIIKLDRENLPIDSISVIEELKKNGKLERSGGYVYVSSLTNHTANFVRAEYYTKVIAQKFIKRELVNFGNRLMSWANDETVDIDNVLSSAFDGLDEIAGIATCNTTMHHISTAVDGAIDEAFKRAEYAKSGKITGVTTGIIDLDRITAGLNPGELVIIAGRPGSGKTSILLHLAKVAALTNHPVCAYSLEMTSVKLADRLILSETNIEAKNYRRGELSQSDYTELSKAQNFFSKLPLYVDDKPTVSMTYIKAHSKKMRKRGLCDIILIDYLQLVDLSEERNTNREQDIAKASRQAKIIAKELGVPVVLLAQLNRECEKRADKRPELSDLRESGAIEQDADKVILVYRPEYYGLTVNDEPIKNVGKLIVAKNRDGAVGEVKFSYNDSLTKISDYNVKIPY